MIEPWFSYLKLFNTALEKLPTISNKVWRGMSITIANNLKKNEDIIWGCISSCSSSIDIIKNYLDEKSILCSIEVKSGKHICGYTGYLKEDEVLLLPGTRLRVKKIGYDSSIRQHVIHLVEIANENHKTSTPIHTPISSTNKPFENASGSTDSTEKFVSKTKKTVNQGLSDRDEPERNKVFSVTTFTNGDRYEVTYKKGEKQGCGKFYTVNGKIYEGDYADIKAKGNGVRIWSNGDRYEGAFTNGTMDGYGSFSCANGYVYVGKWIADEPYGDGTSDWPNGNHYQGHHEEGKICGYGIYSSANGDKYEGILADGKAHGRGLRIWADGDRYEGKFKDDKKHGYGIYNYANGGEYRGYWANDEMDGAGIFKWPSGNQYDGSFKNGKRHGIGKLTFADGRIEDGAWENDKFIG
ncbi:unnamed protein product [Rotaria sordida]|uniref:Uncharacterized protein n=2 Tax=Rotaria sordida TaxID=392033 RepID=A0A814WZE2_9BILA|nr:unnamed protein product [Rotaria sordida]